MNSSKKAASINLIWGLLCILVLFLSGSVAAQAVRIMPLGNSLTAGMPDAGSDPIGGYRDNLFEMLTTEDNVTKSKVRGFLKSIMTDERLSDYWYNDIDDSFTIFMIQNC